MGRRKKFRQSPLPQSAPQSTPSMAETQRPSSSVAATRQIRAEQRIFSGPLPPPEALEKYNQILPGLADRIVAMAEGQSKHRQHIEQLAISAKVKNERRGQYLAFILAAITLSGSFWIISLGRSPEGIAGIIGTLVTLAGVFIFGRWSQRREMSEKRRALLSEDTES